MIQVQRELGVPVKLVGLGEGPDDLAFFDPEVFVDAILGDSGAVRPAAEAGGLVEVGVVTVEHRRRGRRRWGTIQVQSAGHARPRRSSSSRCFMKRADSV